VEVTKTFVARGRNSFGADCGKVVVSFESPLL